MIIDSHVHFGKVMEWDLREEEVIESMKLYNIDFSIVSNLEGAEFDHKLEPIPEMLQSTQIELNRRTIEFIDKYPDKISGQFWIKPLLQGWTQQVEDFIYRNKKYFCAIKIHPYHSKLAFTIKNYREYIHMARRLALPMAIHTATDELSASKNVYKVAKEYPDINFIMVHMDLGGTHQDAIEYIKKLDNLYGDTTWVDPESALKAVKECGSTKIMFGTDATIDGVHTYKKYEKLMKTLKENLSEEEFDNVFCKNAKRIFDLRF